MADRAIGQIKALYFELKALLSTAPTRYEMQAGIADQYNSIVDELSTVSDTDYSRFRIEKTWSQVRGRQYYTSEEARAKISRLVARLNAEFSFEHEGQREIQPPIVVHMNQSQQMSVTVTNISNLINSVEDEETKELLAQLRDSLEEKDEAATKSIMQKILDKSFEVFIKVLPYILDKWGQSQ